MSIPSIVPAPVAASDASTFRPTPHADAPTRQAPETRRARRRAWWMVLLAIWVVAAAYTYHRLPHTWVAHDEGTLAQSAERVMLGELPHRDFDEVYTGGLSYLNAAAFRVLGVNLLSLRLVLFVAFLAWIPAVFYVATRVARLAPAAAATVLAIAWSIPTYPSGVPSWYNLFLATFSLAALMRHAESGGRRRWLVAAGACVGLSCLFKIVGIYGLAAALLYFVAREQELSRDDSSGSARGGWYAVLVSASLALFVTALALLVRTGQPGPAQFHFVLPGAALALALAADEWRSVRRAPSPRRLTTLLGLLLPFLAGLLVPVAIFLVPYVLAGAVGALLNGLFVAPAKRLSFATNPLPALWTLVYALPALVLLGGVPARWTALRRAASHRVTIVLVALLGMVAIALSPINVYVFRAAWFSLRPLVPFTALAGCWLLWRRRDAMSAAQRQRLVLVLAAASLTSLVQFPFSAPIYFMYAAPLGVLAALAVVAEGGMTSRRMAPGPLVVYAFCLLFTLARIHPTFLTYMGFIDYPDDQTAPLALPRGGITVRPDIAAEYQELVATLRAHSRGAYTYATPDCPEVYFLSGLRNPTRTVFDFFDDPNGRTERVLRTIDEHGVTAIAVNREPEFSPRVSQALADGLTQRFPNQREIGQFVVLWR